MLDRRLVRICVELKNFYSIVDKQSGPLNHLHLATACFKSEESAKLSVLIPLLLLNELITSHILPRDYDNPNSNRQLISPYFKHLNHELGYFSKNKLSGAHLCCRVKKQVLNGIKNKQSKRKKYPRHSWQLIILKALQGYCISRTKHVYALRAAWTAGVSQFFLDRTKLCMRCHAQTSVLAYRNIITI